MTMQETVSQEQPGLSFATAEPPEVAIYTRYCTAPPPRFPVHEPSYVHTLILMMWLGRLIDPLPFMHHHGRGFHLN
jgi:hypothetical protein